MSQNLAVRLSDSRGILILFDITDRSSLDHAKELYLDLYGNLDPSDENEQQRAPQENEQSRRSKPFVIFLANKCDVDRSEYRIDLSDAESFSWKYERYRLCVIFTSGHLNLVAFD